MVNKPKIAGTKQFAKHECACGCGDRPRNWKAKYIQGHRPLRPLSERLWSQCKRMPNGCLEWQRYCHPTRGYGQIGRGRKEDGLIETHRAAWEITYGPIPAGMLVCHQCDNPPCCDPGHLFLGTHADNNKDARNKNRTARGHKLPHTKLSDEQVAEIRLRYLAQGKGKHGNSASLAEEFGISVSYVSSLARGEYR